MSKDNNPDVSDLDPLANRTYTEEEKQKLEQEQKEFLNQTASPQATDGFGFFAGAPNTPSSTSSLSALSGSIADNGVTDRITAAFRKQILGEQLRLIREHLLAEHKAEPQKNPDLGTYLEDDEKFKEFQRTLNADPSRRDIYDNALKNADLKKQLEATEINGYRNIHSTFSAEKYPGGFKQMSWDGPTQDSTRSQIVKNGVGAEICTLIETTHATSPITVQYNGKPVTINSYRTIDFPVKLDEKASGTMHLSLVAKDVNGNAPSVDKAVYFTAHYEATPSPNGIPKLKEVSSPQPLKFFGEGKDAVGYIEHGGEIYTLPVTRGNYQEMMKEVFMNKGHSVDLSQTIAPDLIKVQELEQIVPPQQLNQDAEKSGETQDLKTPRPQQVPPITSVNQPTQPRVSQPPQPQQGYSTEIKNQVVNAATELSQAMKDLLNQLNESLKNEVDKPGLIGEVAEKILGDRDINFAEQQAGINTLSKNILSNQDLPETVKVESINVVLETINNDTSLVEANKVELLKDIVTNALNADSIGQASKKQILENVAESALKINDELLRWKAADDITNAVIESNLSNDEKRAMLEGLSNKIKNSELSNQERKQLMGGILEKGTDAGILSEEQQKQMQEAINVLDKGTSTEVSMQDFVGKLEKTNNLNEQTALIKDVTNSALQNQDTQKNINDLTKGILNSQNISPQVKEIGLNIVLDNIQNSNIEDKTKEAIYVDTTKAVLDTNALDDTQKQQLVKKAVDASLVLKEQATREQAIEGITNNVLDSKLLVLDKAEIVKNTTAAVAESDLDNQNKALIAKAIGKTITEHDMPILLEKQAIMESAEQGVVENKADLETKKLMTEGLVNGIHESSVELPVKSKMTDAVSKAIEESNVTLEEKKALRDAADKVRLDRESQNINDFETKKAEQVQEKAIAEVQKILVNPAFNNIAKAAEIKNITTNVLDGPSKVEIKGEIVEGIAKTVANSSLEGPEKAEIVKGMGEAIANNDNIGLPGKVTIIKLAEKGIAESAAPIEQQKQMTAGIVDGIYASKLVQASKFDMTNAVLDSIDQNSKDKDVLKNAANEAILEKETQNLSQNLETKPDLYGAAKETMNALGSLASQIPEPATNLSEEEIAIKTSKILNNFPPSVIKKVDGMKSAFESSGGFKKPEEKKAESKQQTNELSEQQINELVESYKAIDDKYKPQYEQQKANYDPAVELNEKKEFIEKLGVEDDTNNNNKKIKLLSTIIQYERDNNAIKRGVNNIVKMLTEKRTDLEKKVAKHEQPSSEIYANQTAPRKNLGLGGNGNNKNGGRTP